MKRVVHVRPLPGYRLALTFDDGVEGGVDVADLVGKGVFAVWQQPGEFQKVSIGGGGELAWASGVDLCPDALFLRVTGKTAEDIFPSLRRGDRVA